MKGIQNIKVSNRYASYEFQLLRNITIICGESGTGKTTLYNMIADYTRDREKSGINLSSTSPCIALTDTDWINQLNNIHNSIVFIDEGAKYITSTDFAKIVKSSDNYYVIFNRENLHNLPYSISEIYEIKTSGKYHKLKSIYSLTEKSEYECKKKTTSFPSTILTEDSNSGYQFFNCIANDLGIRCDAAGSNSSIFSWLMTHESESVVIISDGAAFGSEINRVAQLINRRGNVRLFLPESFEWVILKSGLVENVNTYLENPSEYIECSTFFSWEQFFTYLLTKNTCDSYLAYNKSELNENYLHQKEKSAILAILPSI